MRKHMYSVSIPVAVLLTAISIIYQRSTGPTYPKKFRIESAQGEIVKIKLPRSQETTEEASIEIPRLSVSTTGVISYRRFPTKDTWTQAPLISEKAFLSFKLPIQPPAGKLAYFINLEDHEKTHALGTEKEPVFLRYKGAVPLWILAPHITCMFIAMLLSSLAALEALYRTERFYPLTLITLGFLFMGGMVLGPLVQKYAFGVYWAGFPYGFDLTDNKLLIGVLAWAFAALASWKHRRPIATVIAGIVLILVYSIPHSKMGSEFNYQEGQVQTQKKY